MPGLETLNACMTKLNGRFNDDFVLLLDEFHIAWFVQFGEDGIQFTKKMQTQKAGFCLEN